MTFPTMSTSTRIPVISRGEGEYSALVTNLEEGKTYYYRAYAEVENEVIYGDVFQFIMDSPFVTRLEYVNLMVINSTYLYKKFDTYCMHDTHHTYDRLGVRCVRKLK